MTPKEMCTKGEYLKVFSKCAMVLRNDFRDHDEVIKMLEDEFDQDCKPRIRKKQKARTDEDEDQEEEQPAQT